MAAPRRRALELNELDWWSNWASLRWMDRDTYVLKSVGFPEPFFNRAGLLECAGAQRFLGRLGEMGDSVELVTVYHSCKRVTAALLRSGYRLVDTMTVLGLAKPSFRRNDAVDVSRTRPEDAEDWSRTYFDSFYGGTDKLQEVVRVVRRVLRTSRSTLLTGKVKGRTAGVLAMHRTGRLAGVYCVGTLPSYRKTGVAGTLISHAHGMASSEHRSLFLQTLGSDAAESFYLAGGFRVLYTKDLMARQG